MLSKPWGIMELKKRTDIVGTVSGVYRTFLKSVDKEE